MKILIQLAVISALLFAYNNCTGQFQSYHEGVQKDLSSTTGDPVLETDAQKVIAKYCYSCHANGAALGGVYGFEDYLNIESQGFLIRGDLSSRLITSMEDTDANRMPEPPAARVTPQEIQVVKDWVLSFSVPIINPPTCQLLADKTNILVGDTVTLTLVTNGQVDSAMIAGVPVSNTIVQKTPSSDITYSAQVTNSGGSNTCQSPKIVVSTPPPSPTAPTCQLQASLKSNIIPGDPITLTVSYTGSVSTIKINNQSVTMANPKLTVSPLNGTTYDAVVSGTGGNGVCSVSVTTKPTAQLTKYEFYRAKIGPSNQSVDDMLISCPTCNPAAYPRCIECHSSGGDPKADNILSFQKLDPLGNFNRLKNIKIPNGTTMNLTIPSKLSAHASGHKPKSPPYSTQEINHLKAFENH
ncbi:MAG: hypothetical protein KDD34_02960 [Bdellovibrionales bacterium]|nr:hypothetical protein [Bdellovibrionales bacterium]